MPLDDCILKVWLASALSPYHSFLSGSHVLQDEIRVLGWVSKALLLPLQYQHVRITVTI